MQIDGIAVVFRQGADGIQHAAVLRKDIRGGQVLVQLGVLLVGGAGQVPAAVDGHPQQPCFEMLLTLKDAVVVQQFFKHILHHILSIGCAAAIMHRSAVDGVAVTLHRQGKYFVSGQLSHCYKLSLDARKWASRWNVCGSHGDVHSIYGSASPIIAEQNPVSSIFCVPDAPDRKARPRSPTEVGYPAGLPVSIPRNRKKVKEETLRKKLRMCLSHSAECDKHEYK